MIDFVNLTGESNNPMINDKLKQYISRAEIIKKHQNKLRAIEDGYKENASLKLKSESQVGKVNKILKKAFFTLILF